ncbi:MAG: hypothetical protein JJE55_13185 [Flavobacteriaceae bacterium]|nr:hypothetical protein [Flavobacteriaceae bacterium]
MEFVVLVLHTSKGYSQPDRNGYGIGHSPGKKLYFWELERVLFYWIRYDQVYVLIITVAQQWGRCSTNIWTII